MKTQKRTLLLIAVLGLVTMACGTLSVANQSDYKVLVSVTLPGASRADSHLYQAGEVYDYYPDTGGEYTISVIPQEDYVAEMDRLRASIAFEIFAYQSVIRPEHVLELTEKLANIERTLSSLTTHACSGRLMEDENVRATINLTKEAEIILQCPSVGED